MSRFLMVARFLMPPSVLLALVVTIACSSTVRSQGYIKPDANAEGGGAGGTGNAGGTGGTAGGTGGSAGSVPNCSDGIKNGVEVGVDCGGTCPGCPPGTACGAGSDCAAGYCMDSVCCNASCDGTCEECSSAGGSCQPIPAGQDPKNECAGADACNGQRKCFCSDGSQNNGETSVDCGGSCAPCGGNCSDGIKNNGEADVDCGGPCATKCAASKACGQPSDCASGVCYGGTCCQPDDVAACSGKVCGTATNNCGATVTCGPNSQPCGKCGTQPCSAGAWGLCTGEGVCSPGASKGCDCTGSQACDNTCQWGACNGGCGATCCGGNCCTSGCNGSGNGCCTGSGALSGCSDGACADCCTNCSCQGYCRFRTHATCAAVGYPCP